MSKIFESADQEITFGQYRGMALADVIDTDPQYLKWCVLNVRGFKLSPALEAEVIAAAKRQESRPLRRNGSGIMRGRING